MQISVKWGKIILESIFKNFCIFFCKDDEYYFIEFIYNAPVSVINNKNDANKTTLRESNDNNFTNIKTEYFNKQFVHLQHTFIQTNIFGT